MSYASHQEAVSHALRGLLVDTTPVDEASTQLVLACRDHAINALRERLHYLGDSHAPGQGTRAFQVASIPQSPLRQLSRILDSMPHTEPAKIPPSTLFPGPPARAAESVIDRWRCVARDLFLGTAELTRADHQPWTYRSEAGWFLVADTASTLESLLVLDHALTEHGGLPTAPERALLTHRLVAGNVAKMARWFGTDNVADLAEAGARHQVGVGGAPPITMVRRLKDYSAAQRTLTALLNGAGTTSRPGSDQRPGIKAARALATGQIRLAQTFAHWAESVVSDPALAEQFRSRIPALRALHVSTSRLAEVEPRRSPLLLAQQSEMVMQLRAATTGRVSRDELHDLNRATHEFTVTLGRVLRREATHTHNIVALDSTGMGLPKPQHMTRTGWAFTAACQQLADQPSRVASQQQPAAPVEREKLRMALDDAAVGKPPPLRRMTPSIARTAPPGHSCSPTARPSL